MRFPSAGQRAKSPAREARYPHPKEKVALPDMPQPPAGRRMAPPIGPTVWAERAFRLTCLLCCHIHTVICI